jgi:hypothetical protein
MKRPCQDRFDALDEAEEVIPESPVMLVSSNGRRNTIQYIDSTMLPQEKRSVWLYSVKT